jgi:SAM-dependent methyltransferase
VVAPTGGTKLDYRENIDYWSNEYYAPNVENFIFRFHGRILRHDFGIFRGEGRQVFDFGCGQGGALQYFLRNDFDVYGVDIAKRDIETAKKANSSLAKDLGRIAKFEVIDPQPRQSDIYFNEIFGEKPWMDVAISIQTLDFLSDTDCQIVLRNIHKSMKTGAVIYASFNGTQLYYFQHSVPHEDGLRRVKFSNGRVSYDLLLNFCESKDEMISKFSMFKPLYVDYYDSSFRNEGSEFRWTFCGTKE